MVEDQQPLVNGDHRSEAESEMVEEEPENTSPGKETRSSRSKSPDKAKKRDQQRNEEDKEENTPRRKKRSKLSKSKEMEEEEVEASDAEMTEEEKPAAEKSALDHIPDDIRFDPKSLENKPKGLVDALSNFFTPGLKRTSRTAMNSLLKPESAPKEPEQQQQEVKKVRLSVDDKEGLGEKDGDKAEAERKRHASAGQQQVLQDITWHS